MVTVYAVAHPGHQVPPDPLTIPAYEAGHGSLLLDQVQHAEPFRQQDPPYNYDHTADVVRR
jgi:hypothetical protein